jgi:hypothetical protein
MSKSILYCGEVLNGHMKLPVEVTVGLLNALVNAEEVMAAIAYASKFMQASLLRGEQFTIFECAGVPIIATLVEDSEDWHILLEPCVPSTFQKKDASCTSPL